MFENLGEEHNSQIIFATKASLTHGRGEGPRDQRVPHMPLEDVLATQGDRPHKRRLHTREPIRDVLKLCEARALQGRAPRGDMARQVIDALPKPQKEEEQGMMPMAPATLALCCKDW